MGLYHRENVAAICSFNQEFSHDAFFERSGRYGDVFMLTWPELAKVVAELKPRVQDGQLQKVRQPDGETLCLTIRTPGRTSHLILSVRPQAERLAEAETQTKTLDAPTALGAWVRRHARGRRVTVFSIQPNDRIVDLVVGEGRLTLELFNKTANLYAIDAQGRVVASARPPRAGLSLGAEYVPADPLGQDLTTAQVRFETALAVEAHYRALLSQAVELGERRERARLITRSRKRLGRLEARVGQDIARCVGADSLRKMGDLLKGQLHLVRPKADHVIVDDWFDESMPKVTIELDPSLDGPGNVERLFHRYRRARDGAVRARARQAEVSALRDRLEALIERQPPMDELQAGLISLGLLKTQSLGGKRKVEPRKPYFEFTSVKGERIWVGRGGRDNHETTFRHARGNDHWLHARDCPGAHVIVPRPRRDQEPHPETLMDAAALAVHNSKMRGESAVPVSHTLRKHLRPIKGGAPGQVTIAGAKTITPTKVDVRITRLYTR